MPRTLMPTPDDPRPDFRALLVGAQVDLEAHLDFLRGDHAPAVALQASPCPPPGQDREPQPVIPPSEPASPDAPQPDVPDEDTKPPDHHRLTYLPLATWCYAIVQYDVASARVVRRIVGLFGDAVCAETYARDNGYHLYDVVPATAVMPAAP